MIRPRRSLLVLAGAMLLVATSCGPKPRLHLGLREESTNVIYGSQTKPTPPPIVPMAALEPSFPSFTQAPLPVVKVDVPRPDLEPPLNEPKPDCPSAGFSIPPKEAATPGVAPPAQGTYLFRQTGFFTVGDQKGQPPAMAARIVQNVKDPGDGTFTYDVVDLQPTKVATITSYYVDQRTGEPATDGIYMTQVVTQASDGSTDQFVPANPILVLPLPADPGDPSFASAGTDGVHNTTMQVNGSITGHGRVDACGTVLDSWEVNVSGRILSPTKNISFTSVYDVGTQFGGLILVDHLQWGGTDNGAAVAPSAGAGCTGGTSQATVDTVTTIANQTDQCPGVVVSRDTTVAIAQSPLSPQARKP